MEVEEGIERNYEIAFKEKKIRDPSKAIMEEIMLEMRIIKAQDKMG